MPDRGQILQELARRGALPEQHRAEYEKLRTAGNIAPAGGFKPMPDAAATKLEEQVNAFAGFDRAVNAFKDDFSGPGSGFENTAQGVFGTGTPGQRDWWSDFRSSDNVARNALFGASLTPSEQASYAATSIIPNMTASEIRKNLSRRRDLAQQMLDRRVAFARANGYTPEAVTAILGDYDPAKRNAQVRSLSVDSVTDYALGLKERGKPEQRSDGSIAVRMPDGTETTFPNRDAYERSTVEEQLAGVFGGDRSSEGYRAAYKARFGEDAPLPEVDADAPVKPIDNGDGMVGAFGRGVGDTVTFGALDELGGVVDTLAGDGGDGSFTDRLGRNIIRNRGIEAGDEQNHPYARLTGQVLGGAAIPFGAGARSAAELARVGGIGGAAYGLGSGEGNALERVPGALGGGFAGALGGYAFGRAAPVVGNAISRFRSGPSAGRVEANALAQAGERQGVPMNAADLRPGARNALAFLEASPGGSGPIQNALATGNDALEAAAGRVGGGTAQSPEAIGSTVQDAGRRMIERTRQIKNDLYADAERLAPTTTVQSQNAVDVLDRNIAELSQMPNANRGLLNLLQDLRGDLVTTNANGTATPRSLAVSSIRNLRTAMRGEIGTRNLTMTDAERRVSEVIDAASSDITDALNRTDPRAAAAYRRADQYYAQRQRYIRDVVQHYTGPRDQPMSGEQTYQRIMALAGERGDRERLAGVMRGLSPDERADVATTIASNLGRRTPEDDFSAARFVTQAQKMPAAARETVFGRDGAEALNDLIHIATAKRDTGNSLNRSRSGQVANYDRWLTGGLSLLGAGGGYAAGGAGGAAVGAVAAGTAKAAALNLSARLLTNPQFVSWLGRAPSTTTPAQITAHIRQLSNLAVRQPAIRGEVQQLQRYLSESATTRSLASERGGSDDKRADDDKPVAAAR
ncbi:hypothetical protein KZ813_17835 [Sphingomonas sp. RHCKR7]|uniref:hypothetical protein n=1 Tax=Sphingomonas folli TaxID=2862497 RepID=UPI001CA4DDD2|nr:hypothetical protein [Sphingomonas folli]MBW6528706.1 hypothetical protein [Sphingomonas folli]